MRSPTDHQFSGRSAASIHADLRTLVTVVARNALDEVRSRLIPAGELLIELEACGDVRDNGGWQKYAASGGLEANTGIVGKSKSTIYSYITLALFGYDKFAKAVERAAREGRTFDRQAGLDWACDVVRWAQNKIPLSRIGNRNLGRHRDVEKELLQSVLRLRKQRAQLLDAAKAVPQLTGIVRRISGEITREGDDNNARHRLNSLRRHTERRGTFTAPSTPNSTSPWMLAPSLRTLRTPISCAHLMA